VPDHSTFSKNRHGRFRDSGAFRHLFETVLQRCISEGLVGGEGFAIAGGRLETERKNVSLTDPAAEWTCAPGGPAFFAYSTNYLVDVQAGVIVDVEATSAHRTQEINSTRTMIERAEQRFALRPKHLIGDMAYGAAPMLGWLVQDKQIAPHIPVWDKSERDDGTFSRSDFTYDAANNRYVCPAGKFLKPSWRVRKKNPFNYRASQHDCQSCPLKQKCCPNMSFERQV
jgi:hypothetical protein